MSKQSMSGLKTVKRDWSEQSSQPSSVELIEWSPSPPKPKVLTGSEKRLKDIQDALAGRPVLGERIFTNASSQVINKRPSPTELPPAKKLRQLPVTSSSENGTVATDSLSSSTTWTKNVSSGKPSVSKSSTASLPSSSSRPGVAAVFLSQEQNHILKLVQEGHSVFYTGSAGTGKSVLLREIIKTLRRQNVKSSDAVAITASTGIAACNIGGVTIHSFAGIGLGIENAEVLAKKVQRNKKATARWLRTRVLIIDEVSMVDGDLFDKLSEIGKRLRKKHTPFGGIQIVVTGDFFQLPPVAKAGESVKFAFEAECWQAVIKHTFNLTKVFRQQDEDFVGMLNEMRFGKLSAKSIAKFRSLSRDIVYNNGLEATELFPRREDVDRSNSTRMNRLQTATHTFIATDGGQLKDPTQRAKMLANFMAPQTLVLRKDAQVMLIKNCDELYVNGSVGRIMDFVDPTTHKERGGEDTSGGLKDAKKTTASLGMSKQYPLVEFSLPNGTTRHVLVLPESFTVELPGGEIQVSRIQVPLILSWAMSIHKSQGQTLQRVRVDLRRIFEKGQAYVALSRATSLDGLQVLGFDARKVVAHPRVVEWSRTLETVSTE